MPHSLEQRDDVSLRHLPDQSDVSFSFQLPAAGYGEHLLSPNEFDFFKGLDDVPTPAPSRTADLLTLSQLTPRPRLGYTPHFNKVAQTNHETLRDHVDKLNMNAEKNGSVIGSVSSPRKSIEMISSSPKPRAKETIQSPGSCSTGEGSHSDSGCTIHLNDGTTNLSSDVVQMEPHQGQLVTANESEIKENTKRPHVRQREKVNLKNKHPTVFAGGISKTRARTKAPALAPTRAIASKTLPTAPDNRQSYVSRFDGQMNDTSMQDSGNPENSMMSNLSVLDGVAERLVMYSQKLYNSYELFDSGKLSETAGNPDVATRPVDVSVSQEITNERKDDLLTLSQLSPSKKPVATDSHTPTPPAAVPMSPMRGSRKRPVEVDSDQMHKKGRLAPPTTTMTTMTTVTSDPKGKRALTSSRLKISGKPLRASGSSSSSKSTTRERTIKDDNKSKDGKPSRRKHRSRAYQQEHDAQDVSIPTLSKSASITRTSTSKTRIFGKRGHKENQRQILGNNKSDENVSQPTISLPETHVHVNPTKPFEFKFGVEARLEARKVDIERETNLSVLRKGKHGGVGVGVPDFKALHAAYEAEHVHRKENIQPIIPLAVKLHTEERVKERQKFDEKMREKEREMERVLEIKRREQEEAEEREIKELRKKAIPKANEVPEWYKEAPKRKRDGITGSSVNG